MTMQRNKSLFTAHLADSGCKLHWQAGLSSAYGSFVVAGCVTAGCCNVHMYVCYAGTPSAVASAAAFGPWAQPLDTFTVMDSPAVRAELAARQQQQQQPGTAGSSPAGSLAASPGCVSGTAA